MIRILAQPLAIACGVIRLWAAGHTLNIYSMIGLMALVSKNSTLLLDLINRYLDDGMAAQSAIRQALYHRAGDARRAALACAQETTIK